MIQLNNVEKIYEHGSNRTYALKEIQLHIPKGQIFGVIGASGAGKSTLIRCVNMLEPPSSGEVIVDGIHLNILSKKKLNQERRKIAMIFQHFNLLSSRTVAKNIAFPLEIKSTKKANIKARVQELVKLVGLEGKENAYPSQLSGGQKQRVAIARALASDPKVLLCDEATSALDPATTKSILQLLAEINARLNLTILLITHEMEVVKQLCHKVAIIDNGEIVEQGDVADIFSHPKTQIAQKFIQSTLFLELPANYQKKLLAQPIEQSYPVVQLTFTGSSVDTPVISHVSKRFDIDISILCANVEYIGDTKFGLIIIELFGEPPETQKAIDYFQDNQIKTQVYGYIKNKKGDL